MNGNEVLNFFKNHTEMYRQLGGIIAIDQLPWNVNNKQNKIFIVNTDFSFNRGLHWICIYISKSTPCEYFDPLGNPPSHYSIELENFLISQHKKYYQIKRGIQNQSSISCGKFCLYYAYYRSLECSMTEILSNFSSNSLTNEFKVTAFYLQNLYKKVR
jgi:hypothetical protein